MKRIIKVLVVTALMVVLTATSVSPAFATTYDSCYGFGCDGENDGYGQDTQNAWKKQDGAKGFKTGQQTAKYGWQCGHGYC